jgi:hypothetical protein
VHGKVFNEDAELLEGKEGILPEHEEEVILQRSLLEDDLPWVLLQTLGDMKNLVGRIVVWLFDSWVAEKSSCRNSSCCQVVAGRSWVLRNASGKLA